MSIIENLKRYAHIDGVVLAGTELPLILTQAEYFELPSLNTTKIHANAAIEWMLE